MTRSMDERETTPDHQLRSQIMSKWERRWIFTDNQEVGLEAAMP